MTSSPAEFRPDWASPPGETIADIIDERGWTQNELATRLGFTTKHVSQLINGKAPVSEETALRLERVVGGSLVFWLNREAQFREKLVRKDVVGRLENWKGWLDELPLREMMAVGAIAKRRLVDSEKPMIVQDALAFFSVASPEDWRGQYKVKQVAFRRTKKEQSNIGAISAWLRMGERAAEALSFPDYDRSQFLKNLKAIRALTREAPEKFYRRLHELCLESGVALVLVPAIKRAHVSGAARWLDGQPVIQLSLYGKTNDRFWFTFFHEAAHVLFHERGLVFLDETRGDIESDQEDEANRWAGEFLIAKDREGELKALATPTKIIRFADDVGIHPGIVVGRLQHAGLLDYNTGFNSLKVSFRFAK